jgi:cyanophycinase
MPSKVLEGGTRGWIVPIGGAENKENDRRVLARFVECRGREGRHRGHPDGGRLIETGALENCLRASGRRVSAMDFTRRDCGPNRLKGSRKRAASFYRRAQPAPLTTFSAARRATMIRRRNAAGVTVGGTSAGASILSEHMIAFGDEGCQ